MKTLEVIGIEEKVSEEVATKRGNGGRYLRMTFKGAGTIIGRDEVGEEHYFKVVSKVTSITVWVDSPIPGRDLPDYGHDLKIGDKVPGSIVTREVMPYFIPSDNGNIIMNEIRGRIVSSASVPVFGVSDDAEDWRMEVDKTFRQRNFILKGEGNLGAPGGNIAAALTRPRTRTEGMDIIGGLPLALQEAAKADPNVAVEYSNASRQKNQDEGDTTR